MLPATLQFLIAMIACAVNERMQLKLEYTQEKNRAALRTGLKIQIKEFIEHDMTERFHQGTSGQLVRNVGPTNDNGAGAEVDCRPRLTGLLHYHHREAA
jgi:hypothetical protein